MESSHNLFPFIFVGCWNKTGARPGSAQAFVMDGLRTAAKEAPLLFLGGDNIYPDKWKDASGIKHKSYPVSRLNNMIPALPTDIEIYTAIGNHNINTPAIYAKEKELHNRGVWKLPADYYHIDFNDGWRIIIINTNLYYSRKTSEQLLEQEKWLRSHVTSKYILIMHEPLISFKNKSYQVLHNREELLQILYEMPPRMILCADTHNFQQDLVELSPNQYNESWDKRDSKQIPQLVVGTGGASPDSVAGSAPDSASIQRIKEPLQEHGFVIINEPLYGESIPQYRWNKIDIPTNARSNTLY